MRFHVIGVYHTQTTKQHCSCAFTQKVLGFCKILKRLGHEVIYYGPEVSDAPCDEHVQIVSTAEQEKFFGQHEPGSTYDVDWLGKKPYWQLLNCRVATAILERKRPRDFVCTIMGKMHKQIAEMVGKDVLFVEFGIGYDGTFADYRVFESYAHMHKIRGAECGCDPDGRFYDAVIPAYVDFEDFSLPEKPPADSSERYYLFIGRLIKRKGIRIAVETCKRIGAKLLIAGTGCKRYTGNKLICEDGEVYEGDNGSLQYVGFADLARRVELYRGAIATFVPTLYCEPFGAVVVESQACGTPIVTTDWGAFPENVEHGKCGFRCRTLEQFIFAAKEAPKLDRAYIRQHAMDRWSLERAAGRYAEYFQMLWDLWDKGWGTLRPGRTSLGWLV
jgi:glycosyltransferase involved in cell wall biosynthesis